MAILKRRTIILSVSSLIVAIIYGFFIENSRNDFFSVLLVGAWILFVIKYYEKRKHYNEFNSPHNTPFFLFAPLIIGVFYNFWSYYTGFLGADILGSGTSFFYLSSWSFIFSFPWLIHVLYILRKCFKEFNIVYIYKTKSVGARKFVIGYIILIILGVIINLLYQTEIVDFLMPIVSPTHPSFPQNYFDAIQLVFSLSCIYLLVRHGIFGAKRSVPELTSDYINRRRRQIDQVARAPARATSSRTSGSSSTSRSRRPSISSTPSARRQTVSTSSTSRASSARTRRPKTTSKKTSKAVNYDKYKPKGMNLTLNDFKCIFCFKLPSYPADKGRGIVLCPKCNYPAHADEFKDWSRKSSLCSRCDGTIPQSFRNNPKIISVKKYEQVIEDFKKKRR